jgi:hypothetical protein
LGARTTGHDYVFRPSSASQGAIVSTIEESIDIEVPVSTATSRWTQFEAFPADAEVTFVELNNHCTRVIVQIAFEPPSLGEHVDNVVGIGSRRIKDGLESFKDFSEHRAA